MGGNLLSPDHLLATGFCLKEKKYRLSLCVRVHQLK